MEDAAELITAVFMREVVASSGRLGPAWEEANATF